jgi:hypothetical protein
MPEISERLTLNDMRQIPIGSRIQYDSSDYVLDIDGVYDTAGNISTAYAPHQIAANRPTLLALGDGVAPETVQQYGQRLRTLTLGQAFGAGVSRTPIYDIFEQEGINALERPIYGMWAHIGDQDMRELLPRGAVGVSGDHTTDQYGIWIYNGDSWQRAFGPRTNVTNAAVRVLWLPDDTEVDQWDTPAADEEERLRALKARLYDIGIKAKSANGWCGEYEQAMGRAGIDDAIGLTGRLTQAALGGVWLAEPRPVSEFESLPPGSLGADRNLPGAYPAYYFLCTDGETWHHATLRDGLGIFRPEGRGEYGSSRVTHVHFVALPVFERGTMVASIEHMRQAVIGSEVQNSRTRYVKINEHQWQSASGEFEVDDPRAETITGGVVSTNDFITGSHLRWISNEPRFHAVVGEPASLAMMSLAPVGTSVGEGSTRWTKNTEGLWNYSGRSGGHRPTAFTPGPHFLWQSVPEESTEEPGLAANPAYNWATTTEFEPSEWSLPRPRIGERVTEEQINDAPVGVSVGQRDQSSVMWRKEVHGWRGNNSRALHASPGVSALEWRSVAPFNVAVGGTMTAGQKAKAPFGTVGIDESGTEWVKSGWDEWLSRSGVTTTGGGLGLTLAALGAVTGPTDHPFRPSWDSTDFDLEF